MDKFYEPEAFGGKLSFAQGQVISRIKRRIVDRGIVSERNSTEHYTKGETCMRIKYESYESTKTRPHKDTGKQWNIYRVKGEALSGKLEGQEWTTQFFASAKEMASQVKALNKGDIVDVKMVANGNFWNPESFTVVEAGSVVGASTPTTKANAVNPPVTNDRMENLKVAVGIMGPKAKKDVAADYVMEAGTVADLVGDYIDKKGVFQFDKETHAAGIPEAGDEIVEPGVD